jgi:hypothetical protein
MPILCANPYLWYTTSIAWGLYISCLPDEGIEHRYAPSRKRTVVDSAAPSCSRERRGRCADTAVAVLLTGLAAGQLGSRRRPAAAAL